MRGADAAVSRRVLYLQQLGLDHPPPRRDGVGAILGLVAASAPKRARGCRSLVIVSRVPAQGFGIVDEPIFRIRSLGPYARAHQSHARAADTSGCGGPAG